MIWRFNLLCDSCNWEFLGFALPWKIPSKSTKGSKTKKLQVDTAERNATAPVSNSEQKDLLTASNIPMIEEQASLALPEEELASVSQADSETNETSSANTSDIADDKPAAEDETSSETSPNLAEKQVTLTNPNKKKTRTRIKQRRLSES